MEFIDLRTQQELINKQLNESIKCVLQEGNYILGSQVSLLEERLAEFVGSKYCLSVASGTDALLMALMSLDIGPGDEVITTPFTWISTVEVIKLIGAKPIYCDVDESTFNLDPIYLKNLVSEKTKAIIPVSLFGQCPDFEGINSFAKEHNLYVVEDAAQSFGAEYKGQRSCSLTDISCTSFFPSKPLGCYGDGGAVFTNEYEIYQKLKAIRVHGASSKNNFEFVGLNGRLDTIQAAILLVKLDIFEEEINLRQKVAANYVELIRESRNLNSDIALYEPVIEQHNKSVYAQFTIKTDNRSLALDRLKEENIPYAIHYAKLANEHPAYQEEGINLPISKKLTNQVFSIPMHPYLELSDQKKVISTLFGVEQEDG